MSCQAFEERIALAVGDDLDAAEAEVLEAHLGSCESCRRFNLEMRQSQRAVNSLAADPVDAEVLAGIRAGVLREIERSDRRPARILGFPTSRRHLAWAAALAMAMAAALLLRSGTVEVSNDRPARDSPGGDLRTDDPLPAPKVAEVVPTPSPIAAAETTEPREADSPQPAVDVDRQSVRDAPTPEPTLVVASVPRPVPAAPVLVDTVAMPTVANSTGTEPTFIKLISEEANLVIYWQVNPPAEAAKEKADEISAV